MTNRAEESKESLPTAAGGRELASAPQRSLGMVVRSAFLCDLQPLPKPQVDCEFSRMSTVERSIETLRYNLALLEYRLGSNGWLRAWALSTLKILLLLLVPLAGITILIGLLVPAADWLAQVLDSLAAASQSMFTAVVYLFLTLVALAALIAFVGLLSRIRSKKDSADRRGGRRIIDVEGSEVAEQASHTGKG